MSTCMLTTIDNPFDPFEQFTSWMLFDKEKGYGFITGEDGQDYFFHYSQLVRDGFKTAEIGQKVEFDEAKTEKGLRANNVRFVA